MIHEDWFEADSEWFEIDPDLIEEILEDLMVDIEAEGYI